MPKRGAVGVQYGETSPIGRQGCVRELGKKKK